MPNPYVGNDDAARYVAYYASPLMHKDSVRRLYDDSIRRRRESHRRVAEMMYPPQPRIYRTQEEITNYVNTMVYNEVFRRQRKLAELESEVYQRAPSRSLSVRDLERHVQHMYDQQMRRKKFRERELQKYFGPAETVTKERMREQEIYRELEGGWRPPSAHIKYDDGRMLLVSELAGVHGARASSCPPPDFVGFASNRAAGGSRPADIKRLAVLATPQRVTPKVHKKLDKDALFPPFRLFGDAGRTCGGRR